ncbi:MAG: N-acetylmuramoyl-L-alanine amidase [Actinomycetota bacterium]|nr:N-acetylmuramoyl-L-alanine amidase [Actinomycetota bacterium]
MRGGRAPLTRAAVGLAVLASTLVPSLINPVRALTFPTTWARQLRVDGAGSISYPFPPTHVAFSWTGDERTGVEYRTLDAGINSPWRRAAEAHDMAHGDHHYSGLQLVDRPDAVQWRPVVPRRTEMGPITVHYINTLDGPRRKIEVPLTAEAEATTPNIVTRREWGADESIRRTGGSCTPRYYDVQQLFVHHTVGRNRDPHPSATMRGIYWYHTVGRGWCDIGYNFVIGSDGRIFEGRRARRYDPWELHDSENRRDEVVQGAHTLDHNSGSVGVSLMGNYSNVRLPRVMRRALVRFLAWEADRHNLPPRGRHIYRNPETGLTRRLPFIAGHRDAGQTECPGGKVYQSLPRIRRAVERTIGVGKAGTKLTLNVDGKVSSGDGAVVTGELKTLSGVRLAGREIIVHSRPRGGRWMRAGKTFTGPDGSYSFSFGPNKNTTLITEFKGGPAAWDSQSEPKLQKVAPNVSLNARGAMSVLEGISYFPPGTEGVVLAGSVSPPHPGRGIILTVGRQQEDGTFERVMKRKLALNDDSRFRKRFPVPSDGTYRARARTKRHLDHAVGASGPVTVVVGTP